MTSTVIPFPPQLRVVRASVDGPSPTQVEPALVEHNGRTYRLADLLARMTEADLRQIEATAPRTARTSWDEVVRRWPALAGLIATGCSTSKPHA